MSTPPTGDTEPADPTAPPPRQEQDQPAPDQPGQDRPAPGQSAGSVSLAKPGGEQPAPGVAARVDEPTAVEQPFDPYRFGAPEHPVPPEYAPPGYVPPPMTLPPGPPASTTAPPPGYQPYQPYQQYQPYPTGPPPGGGAYGYPTPPFQPYPQPKTGNGKATAGLVLGIASIVFFWLSFFDAIPVILGLIFGSLGLSEARRSGSGRGQAIAGIVCAAIGAALAIILTVVILTRLRPCLDNYNSGSPAFNSCVHHRF